MHADEIDILMRNSSTRTGNTGQYKNADDKQNEDEKGEAEGEEWFSFHGILCGTHYASVHGVSHDSRSQMNKPINTNRYMGYTTM